MIRFALQKTGLGLLTLWGVATLIFFLFTILPGDSAQMMLGKREDPEALAAVRAKYGLDQTVPIQYVNYLHRISPIGWQDGLRLKTPAVLFAWIFAFLLGPYTGLNLTGSLFTVDDYTGEQFLSLKNLILPALTLGIRPVGVIVQLTRKSILEVSAKDFVRTARAKGLPERKVLLRHISPVASNPIITTISGWFASLLAGAVFVEIIFGWNGMGKLLVEALNTRDLPITMGCVLVIAFIFVLLTTLVDVLYAWLDPRVRSELF